MSGLLLHSPTQAEIERLYHELALLGAPSVGRRSAWPYRPKTPVELIALAGEMLRFDPRLLSILVQYLLLHFHTLNPLSLREHMRDMRWPQALLVVLEFCKAAGSDAELRYFGEYVAAGFSRMDPAERFFLDADRPGSRMALRQQGRNLQAYARWGFIGTERPIVDTLSRRTIGSYDARTRRAILDQLIEQRADFSLADYLHAVDHAISRQQALIDLQAHPLLAGAGKGRGARWRSRRAARKRA